VVMGGPHATYEWKETLSSGVVDVVVRYEGERTLVELVRQLSKKTPDLRSVDGIAFLDADSPVKTPDVPHEQNLDSFPFPARHFLPMAHYARPGTILTSRGCPRKCIFCISSTYEGHYRTRSADNVVDELAVLRHVWGLKDIIFLDNVFTVDTQRVYDICNQIIGDGLGIRFQCVCRVDLISRDLVEMLRAAGCYSIEIGVESAEQEVTDAMMKFIRVDEVVEAAEIVLGYGLLPLFTFQIGSPFDTAATVKKTRDLAAKLRRMGATTLFSVMTPFPGTPLAKKAEEFGLKIYAKDWYDYRISNPVYDTPFLDRDKIRSAFYSESVAQTG
jgi:anaerobic magnesium-protoporphyrin IX monomethyl ester cyclase